jgi:hypothetical protein
VIAVQDTRTGKANVFVHPARLMDSPVDAGVGPPQRPGVGSDGQGTTPRSQIEMQVSALQLILTDKASSEGARRMARLDIERLQQMLTAPDLPANSSSEGRVPEQESSADQLTALKQELTQLIKTLADPGTDAATRAHAQSRADAVRAAIYELGRQHPVRTA